jgi:hypothetical protein
MLPAVRVELEPGLSIETKQRLHAEIKNVPGVLSTAFNTARENMIVTYRGDSSVRSAIAKMPGVKKLHHMV